MAETPETSPTTEPTPEEWVEKRTAIWENDLARYRIMATRMGLDLTTVIQLNAQTWYHALVSEISQLRRPVIHPDCKACQEDKAFHELQYEYMKLFKKHLETEHGESDEWKGEA